MHRLAAPFLLFASAAFCQPDIRVNVDLAQIEAVVTDGKGRHVPGLSAEDFLLKVDGKERKISYLSYVDDTAAPTPMVNGALRRDDVRRTIVFMIDEAHTSAENFGQLVPVIRKFVDEQMGPRDLVSVMASRNSLGFFERFTSDKQQVRAALDRVVRLVGQDYNLINDQRPSDYDRPNLVSMASAFMMEAQHGVAMAAIERAILGLRGMPGRKAVFLMSDGIEFPLDQLNPRIGIPTDPEYVYRMKRRTQEVVTVAAQSGVVFYTFDLRTLEPFAANPMRRVNMQTVPYMLAKETGGAFVQNTNALPEAVAKAMDDMTGYYLLGFAPTPEELRSDPEGLRGRRVQISLRQPGMSARARSSLRLTPNPTAAGTSREEMMRQALFSPFAAGAMRLRVTPVYAASAPGKGGKRQTLVRILLSLDGRDLSWQAAANGKRAVLDLAVAAFAANNTVVGQRDQRHTLEATDQQAAKLSASEIDYAMELGPLKPGPYQIRAAVRDDGTAGAGSAGIYLELPDFNNDKLAISSLVLSQGTQTRQDAGMASRTFTAGGKLSYGCQVYGARTGKGPARVDVEIRLFRDGQRIFGSAAIPLAADPGSTEINVAGSITLPADLPEGEYLLQLLANDRLPGAKPVTAIQATALTLRAASR